VSDDIRAILERMAALEADLTPVGVKHGLNKQQRGVPQLPALFKPKHITVLKNKTDPEHPMKNYFVGDSEENLKQPVEEGAMEEDVLSKVKKGLTDYLKSIEDEIRGDSDLKDRRPDTRELRGKDDKVKDHELVVAVSHPVKTHTMEDGSSCEIHGDEKNGFIIRRGDRELPTRFESLEEANMALEMFLARRPRQVADVVADYVDEA
jgi:hypothetical protein